MGFAYALAKSYGEQLLFKGCFFYSHGYRFGVAIQASVLAKSKLAPSTVERELWQALEEAGAVAQADHRRKQCAFSHHQAERDLNLLVKHLDILAQEILHARAAPRDALRVLITECKAQFLDTELFLEFIRSIHEVLHPEGDPARNCWCEIGNLWEVIRPVTRNAVEAELRQFPELREPSDFVQNMAALLRRFAPKRARKTAVTHKFGLSIGKRWTAFGLTVGTAHDWLTGKASKAFFNATVQRRFAPSAVNSGCRGVRSILLRKGCPQIADTRSGHSHACIRGWISETADMEGVSRIPPSCRCIKSKVTV